MGKEEAGFVHSPFRIEQASEFSEEHSDIVQWVEEAFSKLDKHRYYEQIELKSLAAGQKLLGATPEQQRRYVLASLEQIAHWEAEWNRVRSQGKDEMERINAHLLPGWEFVWGRCRQALTVLESLLKRKLPFTSEDVRPLVQSYVDSGQGLWHRPIGALIRTLESIDKTHAIAQADFSLLDSLINCLKQTQNKECVKHAQSLETLKRNCKSAPSSDLSSDRKSIQPVAPGLAGNPLVLRQAKLRLGIVASVQDADIESSGHDRVPIRADSPLKAEHKFIIRNVAHLVGDRHYSSFSIDQLPDAQTIHRASPLERGRVFCATCERIESARHRTADFDEAGSTIYLYQFDYAQMNLASKLSQMELDFDHEGIFDFFLAISTVLPGSTRFLHEKTCERLLEVLATPQGKVPLTDGERYVLHLLRCTSMSTPPMGTPTPLIKRIGEVMKDGRNFFLVAGEHWADAVNDELTAQAAEAQREWVELFTHASSATSARPSSKWTTQARERVKSVGRKKIVEAFRRWLPAVSRGRSIPLAENYVGDTRSSGDIMNEQNATILRGLLWMAASFADDEMVRIISQVALSAYKKVPGVGPRAVKVGNACIYALSEIGTEAAVGQLALLKVKVKFGTAQKEIEKAFNAAAAKLGLPREEIEELGVPTYGLEEVGKRRESFCNEEFIAEITVDGRDAKLNWFKADGKPIKSVPAKVKAEHKDELKELQLAVKDISAMLPAQCERIDGFFLAQKTWPLAQWRERYLDHPLVGTIARRLIWLVRAKPDAAPVAAMWQGGQLVDANGKQLALADASTVELWHPMSRPAEEVLVWRDFIQNHEIRQPFKQAYREVYPLTEAETRTNTYSNRFASHVIRQHQFNALCAARGWRNQLRLMVDQEFPPARKSLPQWNLRAEYWIEGIGDNYGTDTNETGTYHRLSTDQVRFYRLNAAENYAHAGGGRYTTAAHDAGTDNINEPLPLDQIPPLVFSEVMRDVDLFVGVASVGNDPNWQDGGPEGRYRDYWQAYSFGDLSETAKTRRIVLERLLPRLTKLKDKWTLSDKFLVIKGSIRTYKIHLGSGNILMEPNDQYLCIVPDRSSRASDSKDLFLPFEGDATLSIILSKAFLLAEDAKITDATITRQLK